MPRRLYRFVPIDRSGRIAWFLHELGLPFETISLNPSQGDHLKQTFTSLSPAGTIPLLIDDDDTHHFETGAILQYLADRYAPGQYAPLPEDAARPAFQSWMYYAAASLDPVCFEFVRPDTPEKFRASRIERAHQQVGRHLRAIEEALNRRSSIFPGEFSILDIQFTGPLHYADQTGCLDDYPRLKTYVETMRNHPSATAVNAF